MCLQNNKFPKQWQQMIGAVWAEAPNLEGQCPNKMYFVGVDSNDILLVVLQVTCTYFKCISVI